MKAVDRATDYSGSATRVPNPNTDSGVTYTSPTIASTSTTTTTNNTTTNPTATTNPTVNYPPSGSQGGANIGSYDNNSFPLFAFNKAGQVAESLGVPANMINYALLAFAFIATLLTIRMLKK